MRTLTEAQEIISRSSWCPNSSWTQEVWNRRVSEFLTPSDTPYAITTDKYLPEEMEPRNCLLCGKGISLHYQQADGLLYCAREIPTPPDAAKEHP
jgi:hypothetical protein